MSKSIIFLSDTPPLKYKGSGISVLLYNILNALSDQYHLSIITFFNGSSASTAEIINDNFGKTVLVCDRNYRKLYKLVRFGILKSIVQFISFIFSLGAILKKYNNNDQIFITVVGASIMPVCKAWLLIKFAPKAKHCLYIVDDLKLINQRYQNKVELFLIYLFLKRTIKQCNLLINISDGLKQLYLNSDFKGSIVLPPHYKQILPVKAKTVQNNEFIFLFTGGLNLLYNNSLKLFATAIEALNEKNGGNVIFKLIIQTYSSYKDFEHLNFNPDFVSYSTTNDRSELLGVYQKSDCFVVPYSFAKEDEGMVVTSFPQKIAEIIQYNKKILIFGPDYSSVNNFFTKNDLSFVCSEQSIEALKVAILKTVTTELNFEHYKLAYEKHLSANAVVNTFADIEKQLFL